MGKIISISKSEELVIPDGVYPNFGLYNFAKGTFEKEPIQGILTSAKTLTRVKKQQFIYNRLFAFEGAYAMVPTEFDGYYVSNEYPIFDCNLNYVKPEFLFAYFKSPNVWRQLAKESTGLGHRRQRVKQDKILLHRLSLPPLDWQIRIINVYYKRQDLVNDQQRTTQEINALLPAILDRAFKGEL